MITAQLGEYHAARKNRIRQQHNPVIGSVLFQGEKAPAGQKRNAAAHRNAKVVNHKHVFGDAKRNESLPAACGRDAFPAFRVYFTNNKFYLRRKAFIGHRAALQCTYCVDPGCNMVGFSGPQPRQRQRDFGVVEHVDGVSPAWPLTYGDFEPWYTKAEQLYTVHGERGVDPLEPPATAPYPYPAISHEPRIEQLSHDLAAAGLTPAEKLALIDRVRAMTPPQPPGKTFPSAEELIREDRDSR